MINVFIEKSIIKFSLKLGFVIIYKINLRN